MREFGWSFRETLALTPRRFWFLVNQIQRLRAEEALMQIRVLLGANSNQEGLERTIDALQDQMSEVFVWAPVPPDLNLTEEGLDPEFDRAGLQGLIGLRSAF